MLLVATLSVLGGLWPFGDEIDSRRYTPARGWVLTVEEDRFTGERHCRAETRRISYRNGVATFHFGRRVETGLAQFRVDGGPARWAADVAVEAAGAGAALRTGDLKNTTGGRVHLPLSALEDADTVAIRPSRDARARTFRLDGLHRTVEAAAAQGCGGA